MKLVVIPLLPKKTEVNYKSLTGMFRIQEQTVFSEFNCQANAIVFLKDGELSNDNGPALVYASTSNHVFAIHFKNGKIHNEHGPALTLYHLQEIIWDGLTFNFEEKLVYREEWLINGEHHREDGPAINSPFIVEYYFEGLKFNKLKYEEIVMNHKKNTLKSKMNQSFSNE